MSMGRMVLRMREWSPLIGEIYFIMFTLLGACALIVIPVLIWGSRHLANKSEPTRIPKFLRLDQPCLVVSLIGPEAGFHSLFQIFFLDSSVGLGQILSYATRRIKPNQIRIRKRELDTSNNRSFVSEFVSSEYDFTALVFCPNLVLNLSTNGQMGHSGQSGVSESGPY